MLLPKTLVLELPHCFLSVVFVYLDYIIQAEMIIPIINDFVLIFCSFGRHSKHCFEVNCRDLGTW